MENISNTIKDLELSLLKPEVRSSREALDNLLTDDFIEFGSSGKKYTKADILERLPKTIEKVEYNVTDFNVINPSDDIAIATYKTEKIIDCKDKVVSKRCSHWRKTDNGWQMFFHEATPNV